MKTIFIFKYLISIEFSLDTRYYGEIPRALEGCEYREMVTVTDTAVNRLIEGDDKFALYVQLVLTHIM